MANKKEEQGNLEVNKSQQIGSKLNENEETQQEPQNQNKPSEEEVQASKQEFENAVNDFNNRLWEVGDKENAKRITDYLNHFVNNRIFWYKDGWRGVLNFNEEISKAKEEIDNGKEKQLKLTWQALEFIFHSLSNPGGIGLDSAQRMQDENEDYIFSMEKVGDALQAARDSLNNIQKLQDKWAAMNQGFYLEESDGPIKEEDQNKEETSKDQQKQSK